MKKINLIRTVYFHHLSLVMIAASILSIGCASCASFLHFPTYYDLTTYKSLTDLKPEVLMLYDSFTTESPNLTLIDSIRLKLSQTIEYEKGKGPRNTETTKEIELNKSMYEKHVGDRLNNQTPWNDTHTENCKENIGEAFDIAISTEALKNRSQ